MFGIRKYPLILILLLTPIFYFLIPPQSQAQAVKPLVERLGDFDLDSMVKTAYSVEEVPAIALAVFDVDTVLYAYGGQRSIDHEEEITINDLFHLGSCTKAITAFVAARLIDKGLVNWDTRIFEIFPVWEPGSNPEYSDKTLADLLSHRAGIQPFTSGVQNGQVPDSVSNSARRDYMASFSQWVLTQPYYTEGRKYAYSNAGYVIVAAIIEKITKRTWEELVNEEFFNPLNISGSFGWPQLQGDDQPHGHIVPGQWMIPNRRTLLPHPDSLKYNVDNIRPAGDISMSIVNCVIYLQEILQAFNGNGSILTDKQYNYLLFGREEYSMGWGNIVTPKGRFLSHDGSAGTFYCRMVLNKELGFGVIVLSNSAHLNAVKAIRDITIQIDKKQRSN